VLGRDVVEGEQGIPVLGQAGFVTFGDLEASKKLAFERGS
jgi:hypothetical protein